MGGISATLSNLESLLLRGYDVDALIVLDTEEFVQAGYDNLAALRSYMANPTFPLRVGSGETVFQNPY
jgi:hypothetical protein